MINVLVTAAGGGAGINALRLLSSFPLTVNTFATDVDRLASGQFFANKFQTMAPFSDRERYEKDLKKLIKQWNIDVIIPTLQEELEDIEEILKDLKVDVLISSKNTLKICCNKRNFYLWIDEEFPKLATDWAVIDSRITNANLEEILETVFVKPIYGRGSTGCRRLNYHELQLFHKSCSNVGGWIMMTDLSGKEYTVDCYIRKSGETAFIVPRERIQISDGVSLKGKTIRDEELIENTRKIINKLEFKGPICVQYKRDKDGELKILEVNPRFSGGALITAAAGANAMGCFVSDLVCPADAKFKEVEWKEIVALGYTKYEILND